MPDLPSAMRRNGRRKDRDFRPDEYLCRRVPLELWDDGDVVIDIDAIELPDMSVIRSKYGHPEWARLESDECIDWGVIGFCVGDIPARLLHMGVFTWTFGPRHVPLEENYPHSEVWAYENGMHVNAKNRLDPHLHLRWREILLRRIKTIIRPYKPMEIRQEAPANA
jgi:hypothetical protein